VPSGISVLGLTHTGTAPLTTEGRTWSGSRPSTLPLRRNLVYFFLFSAFALISNFCDTHPLAPSHCHRRLHSTSLRFGRVHHGTRRRDRPLDPHPSQSQSLSHPHRVRDTDSSAPSSTTSSSSTISSSSFFCAHRNRRQRLASPTSRR
jgi:hypothetical protein